MIDNNVITSFSFTQNEAMIMAGVALTVYVILSVLKVVLLRFARNVYEGKMFTAMLPDLGALLGGGMMMIIKLYPIWYMNFFVGLACGLFSNYIYKSIKSKFDVVKNNGNGKTTTSDLGGNSVTVISGSIVTDNGDGA